MDLIKKECFKTIFDNIIYYICNYKKYLQI